MCVESAWSIPSKDKTQIQRQAIPSGWPNHWNVQSFTIEECSRQKLTHSNLKWGSTAHVIARVFIPQLASPKSNQNLKLNKCQSMEQTDDREYWIKKCQRIMHRTHIHLFDSWGSTDPFLCFILLVPVHKSAVALETHVVCTSRKIFLGNLLPVTCSEDKQKHSVYGTHQTTIFRNWLQGLKIHEWI